MKNDYRSGKTLCSAQCLNLQSFAQRGSGLPEISTPNNLSSQQIQSDDFRRLRLVIATGTAVWLSITSPVRPMKITSNVVFPADAETEPASAESFASMASSEIVMVEKISILVGKWRGINLFPRHAKR